VTPLKNGSADKSASSSYRPINLLPTLGKILERLLVNKIEKHTENDLENTQHGFRKNRGTEGCITKGVKSINKMRKSGPYTAAVFVDIQGAFDHLLWKHILSSLTEYKVPAYLSSLLGSYFRSRRVTYGDSTRVITRGCPQGSIIGPLLWNIGYNCVLT